MEKSNDHRFLAPDLADMTLKALQQEGASSDETDKLRQEVLKTLSPLVGAGKLPADVVASIKLCRIATLLVTTNPEDTTRKTLASTLVALLCEWLPSLYKRQKVGELIKHSLDCASTILNLSKHYDMDVFRSAKPSLFAKIFRSCLRYGMGGSAEFDSNIRVLSLRFVRLLLEALSDSSSGLDLVSNLFEPNIF